VGRPPKPASWTATIAPGLYAEEYDARQRQLRGNLPQAFVPSEAVTMLAASGSARAARTRIHEWSVDPLFGPTMWLLDLVDYQTIGTPEDGAKLVAW
jgi:hypothetical protein